MILPWLFLLILIELVVVGWIDLKTKKISNHWSLFHVTLSLVLHLAYSEKYPFTMELFIFPLGFVVIGFILFLMNIMGAGDSKFLATLFLVIPLPLHGEFLEQLILSTMVTGSLLLLVKIIQQGGTLKAYFLSRHWTGMKEVLRSRFSYAPVVCLAWILMGLKMVR